MAIPPGGTGFQRSVPIPFTAVRIDSWVLRLLEADLDERCAVLAASGSGRPGGSCVVLRADGGLWVAVGNDFVWNIFSVPPTAWRPASAISGVVPKLVDPKRKVG